MGERYVIAWCCVYRHITGEGVQSFTLSEAQRICASMNRKWPKLHHWPKQLAAPVRQDTTAT